MRSSDLSKKWAPALGALALVALLGGCGAPDRSTPPSAAAPTAALRMPAPTAAPLASAPTVAPAAAPAAVGTSDRLFIRGSFKDDEERITAIDSAGGARERELPPGVASPDWTTLYTVEREGGKTRVRALDIQTGQVLRETSLDGGYVFPTVTLDEQRGGLSPNGSWLTLEKVPGLAVNKTQSQFVVLDTRFERPPRRVDLDVDGPYRFDGVNNSGAGLYLVQYLTSPSLGAPKYQVRFYDLALGQLSPDVVVAKGEDQVMQGTHQLSVNAPAGDWRFSLYLNNSYGPFIHALNLNDRFAICIDLPKDQKDDEAKQMAWSLALSPNGRTLYAVNGALGVVADIDTVEVSTKMRRVSTLVAPTASTTLLDKVAGWLVPVAEAKPGHDDHPYGGAVVAPDSKTLFALGAQGLLAIDTTNLSLRSRYLADTRLSSVAISPDGARLYVTSATEGKILRLDPATGATVAEVPVAGATRGILRVEAGK